VTDGTRSGPAAVPRNRYRVTVGLVGGATAFSLLGDQALYAVLPVYLEPLGLSAIQVGILLSANRWVRLLTNHLAHRLLERADFRVPFAAALVLGVATTAAYGLTQSFTALLTARLLWGLAWSFIRHGGVMRIMEAAPPGVTGRTMGTYNGISRIGSVLGLFGGAVLVDTLGFSLAMLTLAAITAVSVPMALALPAAPHVASGDEAPRDSSHDGAALLFLVLGFCLGVVGPGFVMSTLGFLLQGRLETGGELGFASAATLTGAVLAVRFALDTLAAPVLGASADRLGVAKASVVFFGIGALALAGAVLARDLITLIALVLVFFTTATALQAGIAGYASRLGAAAFSRYVTAVDVGAAAGPLIAWIALDRIALPEVGLLLGAAFYAVALLVAWLGFSRVR
jgi:DHA1 family multidrug resistance protein-like MFS transporter